MQAVRAGSLLRTVAVIAELRAWCEAIPDRNRGIVVGVELVLLWRKLVLVALVVGRVLLLNKGI